MCINSKNEVCAFRHDIRNVEGLVNYYREILRNVDNTDYGSAHNYSMVKAMPQPYQNLFLYTALSCAWDIEDCFVARHMDKFKYINHFLYVYCNDAAECDFTVDDDVFKQIDYDNSDICVKTEDVSDGIQKIYAAMKAEDWINGYPCADDYLEDGDYQKFVSDEYYILCSAHAQIVMDKMSSISDEFDTVRSICIVDNMQYEFIGEEIKSIRASMGLTQEQFARKFAIKVNTLAHWEQGHRKPPMHVLCMLKTIRNLENQVKALSKSNNTIGEWFTDFIDHMYADEDYMVHILPDDIYVNIDTAISEYRIRKIVKEPEIIGKKPYQLIEITTLENK